jgi:spore coat protein U-like protein
MMGKMMRGSVLGILACAAPVGMAHAACGTSATVTATTMAFGTINPLVLPQDTTATLTLKFSNTAATCTSNIQVTLGVGAGPGATAANRIMTSGANQLKYTIYTPPGPPTTIWDNVTGYTTPAISIQKNKTTTQTVTMYGRVLTGQSNAAVGAYNDTVTITVTF